MAYHARSVGETAKKSPTIWAANVHVLTQNEGWPRLGELAEFEQAVARISGNIHEHLTGGGRGTSDLVGPREREKRSSMRS